MKILVQSILVVGLLAGLLWGSGAAASGCTKAKAGCSLSCKHASETYASLCNKCGEAKGGAACCRDEGREKCSQCGLLKGSPGCCKLPADADGPVPLCSKCGEIKGGEQCCKEADRTKCARCGLFDGSPGCSVAHQEAQAILVCNKCGEVKGSDVCCLKSWKQICKKCKLHEGSPGCCRLPADAAGPVQLCGLCGEAKGTARCCPAAPEDGSAHKHSSSCGHSHD